MRISDVSVTVHERVVTTRGRTDAETKAARLGLVRIRTNDGLEGAALIGSSTAGWGDTFAAQVADYLKPVVDGRDPLDIGALWRDLWRQSRTVSTHAIGAVDVALWSIAAQVAGLPIHRLLGTVRDRTPAYFSSWFHTNDDAFIEEALHYQSLGWQGYKLHPYGDARRDVELCHRVRDEVGDGMALMIDPHCAYTYAEALYVGKAVHDLGYLWLEDPLPPDNVYAYSKLCDKLDIPVLATELTGGSAYGYTQWITERATDMLRGDVALKGGITPLMKIAHLAEVFGLPCEIHAGFNATGNAACLNVIMATASTHWLEVLSPDAPGRHSLDAFNFGLAEPMVIDGEGWVHAPTAPGLGVDLDFALLRHCQVAELC